jgi:hopanoid biosynthesis associated RND transporter like protein HpnN
MSSGAADPHHQPDRLTRAVIAAVGWTGRHPWLVLTSCLLVSAACVYAAVAKLEYHTQRNDLLGADKPCQKRWQKYLDAFGDDDDMVVVVEGTDRGRMTAALEAIAERVKARPDLFDRVFYRTDLRPIHDRAILFLSADQVEGVRDRVERMGPLLGPVASLSWKMLSTQSLLARASAALEARAAGKPLTPDDEDLLAQLPAVAGAAAASLRDPAAYRNPWAVAGPPSADRDLEKQLTEPQYFFTPDGTLAMLVCRPKKAGQSFTPAKEASDAMRAVLDDVRPQFPDLKLGLTGLPVLENDEMALSDVDSERASWLALLGVAVLYFVVYRGFRNPLLTVASLVAGTVWALGWATVTVGHLNILSSTFAVMLIGMGDYGVLWVVRYDEGRKKGLSIDAAMRHTAGHAGPSILTAAASTALAFFATTLADFKAVAELGWIAGWGVLFCAISCLTLLPAALTLVERVRERRAGGASPAGAPADVLPFPAAPSVFLPRLSAHPRAVLAVGLVLLLGLGAFSAALRYDHNLLNLQPKGLDSVAWEHKLIDRAAGATWDSLSIAATRDEALAYKARYEALPGVGRVVEVASLVPADQGRKLAAVRDIRGKLASLPNTPPVPLPTHPDNLRATAGRVVQLASDRPLSSAVAGLLAALNSLPQDAAAARLKEFDRRLATDLHADLHRLKAVSRPAPITLDDLPPDLRERYVGADGQFLVRAFAKESLWDYDALQRFTAAANTADPEATGKAFRTLEGLRQMRRGFEWAGVYALIAIVAVLLLDFRRLTDLLLGLFPLAVGVGLTLGVMGLCGVAMNPANMIALPLIVGVGVDNGVHVLHDFRSRPRGVSYRLGSAVGRGVLISALTTILGFATLMTAGHRGMASLGLALTLGQTFCMVAALVLLPALLRLLDERKARAAAEPRVLRLTRKRAA